MNPHDLGIFTAGFIGSVAVQLLTYAVMMWIAQRKPKSPLDRDPVIRDLRSQIDRAKRLHGPRKHLYRMLDERTHALLRHDCGRSA